MSATYLLNVSLYPYFLFSQVYKKRKREIYLCLHINKSSTSPFAPSVRVCVSNKTENVNNKDNVTCINESLQPLEGVTGSIINPHSTLEKDLHHSPNMRKYLSVCAWMEHIAYINFPLTGVFISSLRFNWHTRYGRQLLQGVVSIYNLRIISTFSSIRKVIL